MSDKFPDKLHLVDGGMRGDSRLFILEQSFRYYSSLGTIKVPSGFVTDGGSVPRIFWNIFDPFGPFFPIAVIHDFLYSDSNDEFCRDEADLIFLEGMKQLGIGFIKRQTIYRAVRMFGWASYKGFKD